jgi:hypothetical protein
MENQLLEAALRARLKGISTVPVSLPGKTPTVDEWKWREERIPDEKQIHRDYRGANGNSAVAIIGGQVSGNLEFLDFDFSGEFFEAFAAKAEAAAPGLIGRLPLEKTLNNGFHLLIKCPTVTIPGAQKLARKKIEVDGLGLHTFLGKTHRSRMIGDRFFIFPAAIETKAEGGYIVCAPSPGYTMLRPGETGDFFNIPAITEAEREILFRCARMLDEMPPEVATVRNGPKPASPNEGAGTRPGDDFNRRGDVLPILLKYGFQLADGTQERQQLTRPGKTRGISATLYDGRTMRMFSSNAPPFEMDTNYSAYAIYAMLEHGSDFAAAARALRREGYGDPEREKPPPRNEGDEERAAIREEGSGSQARSQVPDGPPTITTPAEKPRFEFIHNADIMSDLHPTEWRIRDVLTDYSLYYNFGDPGHFKTFIELDRLLCIASGSDYHGHKVKQGSAFYIAGEGQQGIGRRIAAWHIAHKTQAAEVPFFAAKVPTQLMDPTALDDVERAVDAMTKQYGPPAVVHFDTLARNFGPGDENATKDVNAAISNLDKAFGNDFCRGLTHHTGHANKDRARGAMALHGAADAAFRISLTESGQVLVESKKQKDAPPAPMMLFDRYMIRLRIGNTDDRSYVLRMVCEGDDALQQVKPKKTVELKGGLSKALEILRRLYARYRENPKKGDRSCATPSVSFADWRTACMDAGLYKRTDNFRSAAEKLLLHGFIRFDEAKQYVYLVEMVLEDEN